MVTRLALAAATTLVLAGCLSTPAKDALTSPVSTAANATLPLPVDQQYIYYKKVPGTGAYETVTKDHRLTAEEMEKEGILPPNPAQ